MAAKRRYSSEDDSTKERILQAALECISQTSIGELSVRTIAARAEVNVATVHYYFRTKDAIVTEALELFFGSAVKLLETALAESGTARLRLLGFLEAYTGFFHGHRGIFASLMEAIVNSALRPDSGRPSYEQVLIGVVSQAKPRLIGLVREVSGIDNDTLLNMKTLQLMTSLLHPILISSMPMTLFGLDMGDPVQRRRYIELIVDSLKAC